MLKFSKTTEFEPGIIFSLLSQSFTELWNEDLEKKIIKFDTEIFENPDTVGACTFISTLNGKAVGMASYDPRQGPEAGIIGYNCILPEYQGRGLGKTQIKEIIRRLKESGFKKVFVRTGEHPFFNKARNMYIACGFKESKKYPIGNQPGCEIIDYEIDL
jgi:GNAT superfamily N-acetyltransferase